MPMDDMLSHGLTSLRAGAGSLVATLGGCGRAIYVVGFRCEEATA
jgi:hypothetical protein